MRNYAMHCAAYYSWRSRNVDNHLHHRLLRGWAEFYYCISRYKGGIEDNHSDQNPKTFVSF